MVGKSEQIPASEQTHATCDPSTVPVGTGTVKNKWSWLKIWSPDGSFLCLSGVFCACSCSKRTKCRALMGLDTEAQSLAGSFVIIALLRQKLIVYPDKSLWLHCRHNNVFDKTSPRRLSYPFCLCSPLWRGCCEAYFVLSLSAPHFAVPLNAIRPLCGMSCVLGDNNWTETFISVERSPAAPSGALWSSIISADTLIEMCMCMCVWPRLTKLHKSKQNVPFKCNGLWYVICVSVGI